MKATYFDLLPRDIKCEVEKYTDNVQYTENAAIKMMNTEIYRVRKFNEIEMNHCNLLLFRRGISGLLESMQGYIQIKISDKTPVTEKKLAIIIDILYKITKRENFIGRINEILKYTGNRIRINIDGRKNECIILREQEIPLDHQLSYLPFIIHNPEILIDVMTQNFSELCELVTEYNTDMVLKLSMYLYNNNKYALKKLNKIFAYNCSEIRYIQYSTTYTLVRVENCFDI